MKLKFKKLNQKLSIWNDKKKGVKIPPFETKFFAKNEFLLFLILYVTISI